MARPTAKVHMVYEYGEYTVDAMGDLLGNNTKPITYTDSVDLGYNLH